MLGLISIACDGAQPQVHSHSARAREDVVVVEMTEEAFLAAALQRFKPDDQGGCGRGSGDGAASLSATSSSVCLSWERHAEVPVDSDSPTAGRGSRDLVTLQALEDLEASVANCCSVVSRSGGREEGPRDQRVVSEPLWGAEFYSGMEGVTDEAVEGF